MKFAPVATLADLDSLSEAKVSDECYCDFKSREFFGCYSREHVPPCPQAVTKKGATDELEKRTADR